MKKSKIGIILIIIGIVLIMVGLKENPPTCFCALMRAGTSDQCGCSSDQQALIVSYVIYTGIIVFFSGIGLIIYSTIKYLQQKINSYKKQHES